MKNIHMIKLLIYIAFKELNYKIYTKLNCTLNILVYKILFKHCLYINVYNISIIKKLYTYSTPKYQLHKYLILLNLINEKRIMHQYTVPTANTII
jgi:hypothetical protein